jgi:hypothetical protein
MSVSDAQDRFAVSGPPAVGLPAWPWEALEDLAAQELRLYALGWGDHLPVEVRERIDVLHRRRLKLEAQLDDS